MYLSYLLGNTIALLMTIYAICLILFQNRANDMFMKLLKATGKGGKVVLIVLLRIVRSVLKDVASILDTIIDWMK